MKLVKLENTLNEKTREMGTTATGDRRAADDIRRPPRGPVVLK